MPDTGGQVVVPAADEYKLDTTVNLRAINMELVGEGVGSVITGSASPLIKYPSSVTDGTGNVVVQDIRGLQILINNDGTGIELHQTWDAGGKRGPSISRCHFINTSATTTDAICISLQGVWTVIIAENWFEGMGSGSGPTDNIGGYAIRITPGSDMNTSVMNVTVYGNHIYKIGRAFNVDGRSGDGRVEGLKIIRNVIVAGHRGVIVTETLATTISGNLIHDFEIAVQRAVCFEATVVCNESIYGHSKSVLVQSLYVDIESRSTSISGNNIETSSAESSGACVESQNNNGDEDTRKISIVGNTMRVGPTGSNPVRGVIIVGSGVVDSVAIVGNTFEDMDDDVLEAGSSTHTNIVESANV